MFITTSAAIVAFAVGLIVGAYGPPIIAWIMLWPDRQALRKDALTVHVDELVEACDDVDPQDYTAVGTLRLPEQRRGRHVAAR